MNFDPVPRPIIRPVSGETATELMNGVAGHIGLLGENTTVGLDYQWVIGDGLNRCKAKCKHGEWLPLLESRGISPRNAARWMRAARECNWAPINDDDYEKMEEALLAATVAGDEEEEIPAEVQTDAFAKPKPKRPLWCDPCRRKERTGQEIPPKCKECRRIIKENHPHRGGKKKIKVTGFFSGQAVGVHMQGIERHALNLCKDYKLDYQVEPPSFVEKVREHLKAAKQIIVDARKELKAKLKAEINANR